MKDLARETKCRTCGEKLMPLWKSNKWFCYKCKLEQNLPESNKPLDNWDK
jgi:ribosomal protein L37AE/L43A